MKTLEWNNKKVLITGGSAGLGRALALQLSAAGTRVAVLGRHLDKLQQLQKEQPLIQIITGDIAHKDSIHRIHAEAIEKLGGVDVLVNNASSLGPNPLRLLIDTDCEDFQLALETNLLGAFRLSKLVLPGMILQQSGLIVNISSDAAIQDYPYWGAYSISKSALDHMTRIFQEELKDSGVHFLSLDPGDMNTALHLTAIPEADVTKLFAPEESAQLILKLINFENFSAQHRGLR